MLKVAHHGSEDGSSRAFLDAVDAEVAVISTDGHGHPAQEKLSSCEKDSLRRRVFLLS